MDADRLFTETKQGFDFYHRNFGIPFTRSANTRPAVRARVQRRRDGERWCGDLLGDYVFRSRVTNYLYGRRAETVLHRWPTCGSATCHHDVVGRPGLNESFATFASVLCQASATGVHRGLDDVRQRRKSWATAGTSCPRRTWWPPTSPTSPRLGELRRHHLRQGRLGPQAARRLRRRDPFLAGLRDYFAAHKFDNATFDDLLAALERSSGRDLSHWGAHGSKTTGINVAAPRLRDR